MHRLQSWPTFLLTCALCLNVSSLHADCLCLKSPMFPYSPGYWMYYAEQTANDCTHSSTVSSVASSDVSGLPWVCNTTTLCGACQPLGKKTASVQDVANCHLHTDMTLPAYADVSTSDGIKKFLKANIFFLTDLSELANAKSQIDAMTFTSPSGSSPTPVVLLKRETTGADQNFCAVLWQMNSPSSTVPVFLGVEINETTVPTSATDWTSNVVANSMFRTKVSASDDRLTQNVHVKGLIDVQVGPTTSTVHTYFIRLGYTDKNRRGDAFKLRP